jgi:hypothetical protein
MKQLTPEQSKRIEEITLKYPGFITSYSYKHCITNLDEVSFDSYIEHFEWLKKRNNKPITYQRQKPDFCELNFKDKPWCEFNTNSVINPTNGWCKKCKRDYVLENAKFGETCYDILEGTWVVKKYDMNKAKGTYGARKDLSNGIFAPVFMPDAKWANSVLEDSDMWEDDVIEFAKNILKEEKSSDHSK